MLKGLNIQELAAKIAANQGTKRDLIASTDRVQVVARDGGVKLQVFGQDYGVDAETVIQKVAHDQIAAHTGIPRDYYERMLTGRTETDRKGRERLVIPPRPELLAQNVNTWFNANPQKRLVRQMGGATRAFLSNRYQRIENEEIAEVALPVLLNLPNVQIVSAEVTERRLYIQFVVPTIQGEVKVGDVVQAGGVITNSEVGLGSVSVSGLIWRLWCLNGAKTQDVFRRNHVGRAVEDNDALWADDTKAADDKTVLLKVRDMVKGIVDQTRFQAQLEKLRGLTEGKVTGDPGKAVEVLAQKVGATEGEKSSILRKLIEGGDLSRWGLLNAVTGIAHEAKSYDRAVEIEGMGGALIELPADQWREVLQAA
ncbi:MAG TPA: hypothetical protein VF748_14600 [Candidatus Acidoferrum sp.]